MHALYTRARDSQRCHGRCETQSAFLTEKLTGVEFAQWNCRHAHLIAAPVSQKPVQEYMKGRARGELRQVLIQGTDQNHFPEIFLRVSALAVAIQPDDQRRIGKRLRCAQDGKHGPRDGPAIPPRERSIARQRGQEMQRCRKRRGAQRGDDSILLEEIAVVIAEMAVHAGAAKKIDEIRAAAEQDVLAVVDGSRLARRNKRGGAATQYRPFFDEIHGVTGLGQAQGRRHARQPTAENRYASRRQSGLPPARSCSPIMAARTTSIIFSMSETAAGREGKVSSLGAPPDSAS